MPVSPARACAYAVVRRVFEEQSWADRVLHAEARRRRLGPRDRALATRLALGTVQRRATLDWLIEAYAARPVDALDPGPRAALRLGLFQLVYLDRIPDHAVVGESVELAKAQSPGGATLVNAVLRRAAARSDARARVDALTDDTIEAAALRHSHPPWIAALWWEAYGPERARALLAAGNRAPETAVRANTLRVDASALAARLPVAARAVPELPEALVLEGPFDLLGSPEWATGLVVAQSRAAMAVSRVLAPRPGERVLDLCAAPGGKTTHLAALMENRGAVVAVEKHTGRAAALRATADRVGASCVEVRVADAAEPAEPAAYDRVLVDPPCSDLGTLAARPDARWRKTPDAPQRLAPLQARILRAGARALRPGGVLVYSTCTLSPRENEDLVDAFLQEEPEFAADDLRDDLPVWEHPRVPRYAQTMPSRDGTDGFFIARLRRRGPA